MSDMQAADVLAALRRRHEDRSRWVYVEELRVGTGYNNWDRSDPWRMCWEQRIDAWAMAVWPSDKFERVAYEVKVHRSDFLRELANPQKREGGLLVSNRFYFVAPDGVVQTEELPEGCGLIVVKWRRSHNEARVAVQAPWRDCEMPLRFVASLARRLQNEPIREVAG